MSSRTSKAANGLATSLLSYAILALLQVLLVPIILKIAGQEVLGAYSILMQIIGYSLLLDLGLSVAVGRYLAQTFSATDKGVAFAKVFNIGRYFILATNTISALFIILIAENIGDLVSANDKVLNDARISLLVLSVWTVTRTPLLLYGHGLLASQNMARANIIGIISNTLRLTLSVAFLFAELSLFGLVCASIVSEMFGLLLQRTYFKRLNPTIDLNWRQPDREMLNEIFNFGLKYWGVSLAVVLTLGSDSIVVGHLYGAAAAAIFYTTKIPSFLITQLIYKISDNAGPAANELIAQGKYDSLKIAYLKIMRYSLLLALPAAIGIINFNKPVITAWVGAGQYAGSVMSLALSAFLLTQVINHINAMIVLSVGNLRSWTILSITCSILTLLLAYILGKNYGLQWVMVAIAVMDLPGLIFLIRRCMVGLKLSAHSLWSAAVMPAIFACMPLVGFVVLIRYINMSETLINLLYSILIFGCIWLVSLYVFGLHKAEKIQIIHKLKALNLFRT
jgi:O-antigen/teichoic acid export membrane protein